MGVTVYVPRRRPRPLELVVRWEGAQSAGDLRTALADHLTHPVECLLVAGDPLPDGAAVGMPPLVDGVSLVVASGPPQPRRSARAAALELAVVGGPDAGRSRPLLPPGLDVGRHPRDGLRLDDTAVSRRHARVDVGPEGIRVTDLGSTNGVVVDDVAIRTPTDLDTGSSVVIGRSHLRLRRASGAGLPVHHPGNGTVTVATAAASPARGPASTVEAPERPPTPTPSRIPWVAALVPLPVAAVLAVVLGPQMLAFALLGPVMVLASSVGDRWSGRRRRTQAAAEYEQGLAAARDAFREALTHERCRRLEAHPDPHAVLRRAERRLPGLWGSSVPAVRLGLGDVVADTTWREGNRSEPGTVRGVPVVVDLADVRCLGIVGPADEASRILDWVVGQLAAALPPERVRIEGESLGTWWRLPHARGPTPPDTLRVWTGSGPPHGAREHTGSSEVELVIAPTPDLLPERCRARVEPAPDGTHVLVGADGRRVRVVADGVGRWWAERVARALAPVRSRDAVPLDTENPLTLGGLLGGERMSAAGVRAAWSSPGGGPRAVVGVAGTAPYVLDLQRDGPHVLVGGTTGSGKSEFLRTLVTGFALSSPPECLAMLLVDFKGGAAFGPCARLPHVVGLVTDLDEHLANRVLTSLRAELRRREHLLARAGVADLDDLPRGPAPVPRLLVVVDELRALVDELPDLVSGLVRIAAQGRSLGIHLVLATQRPSGTVTPEIQANVDLRVAFRVRDRTDSLDVLDSPDASLLDPNVPGRGFARGSDGALTAFRTALVAPAPAGDAYLRVEARTDNVVGADPARDRAAETGAVVDLVVAAAADRAGPLAPPPWVPALPPHIGRADPQAGAGVVALVDEPDLQRRSPLRWDPAVPLWRVVGRPLTGRTSAARSVVLAAVDQHPSERLHVHVIDAGGGLEDLRPLPHLGTWCRVGDTEGQGALLEHLTTEVAVRRSRADVGAAPIVLVVVDGWDQLTESDDPRSPDPCTDRLLRLFRDGAGVGIRAVVTGGRVLLQPRWAALGGLTVLLGEVDPLDAAAVGLRERDLPREPPPGRGVLAGGGREVQVVSVTAHDLDEVSRRCRPPSPPQRAWRHRPLPDAVSRREVDLPADPHGMLVGVAGTGATALTWDPSLTGGRLLVAGRPRSGRTTALLTLAESARAAGREVVLVGGAPGPATGWPSVPGITRLGPHDVDELVERRRGGPGLVVLVDDADRLDDAPVRPVLSEMAELAVRDGGAVVVATTITALATRFRGLDVETARHGCGLVLGLGPGDGEVLGIRPRAVTRTAPGRGWWVVHGESVAVQVVQPGSARHSS